MLVKKHLRISKDIQDIKDDLIKADIVEQGADKNHEFEKYLKERYKAYPNLEDLRVYLDDELERLEIGKKDYKSEIAEARLLDKDDMEVDSLTENKRKESSIEDTNPSKRKKYSNNDDSSGPSAPFGSSTSGTYSSINEPNTGNSESGGNNASKITGKLWISLGSLIAGFSDFFDNIF